MSLPSPCREKTFFPAEGGERMSVHMEKKNQTKPDDCCIYFAQYKQCKEYLSDCIIAVDSILAGSDDSA